MLKYVGEIGTDGKGDSFYSILLLSRLHRFVHYLSVCLSVIYLSVFPLTMNLQRISLLSETL